MSEHRIVATIERPDPALVARYRAIKTEILASIAGARLMDGAIRPISPAMPRSVGPAVTVLLQEPGGMMGDAAIAVAQPGDVILVAGGGARSSACWGGGLTRSARNAKVAGVVVDGMALDTTSILDSGVAVAALGTMLRYVDSQKPGSVNVAVVCGGVSVEPGDLVVADLDGCFVLPRGVLEGAIEAAEAHQKMVDANRALLDGGAILFEKKGGRERFTSKGIEWVE